jgi:hypothetical protein
MKSRLLTLAVIVFLFSCRLPVTPAPTGTPPPSSSPAPSGTPSPSPEPTWTPTAAPSPTLDLPTAVPPLDHLPEGYRLRVHPEGGLYVGDLVSFELITGETFSEQARPDVTLTFPDSTQAGPFGFGQFGIAGQWQATMQWVWDTAGLAAGEHPVIFTLTGGGQSFTETFTLLPADLRRFPEPGARWAIAESDCCLVYYITGTAAERDLAALLDTADAEAESTFAQIGGEFTEPLTIVFLPRVLGHGGFAGSEIYISYLDRNYAGNAPAQVIHHEMVHTLDGRLGGDYRPTIFVEGLAVLLSGGHFKPEDIVARVAATLELDLFIPLTDLTEGFYFAQHEVSYAEGAALIQFMSDTYGYEAFDSFYRSMVEHPSRTQVAAINQALQVNFNITFEQLEAAFTAWLAYQPADPAAAEDIRLTVLFYDTVRRYQQALDPSAYFLTAWLLGIGEMTERGIVADYLRHPASPENIALETLLVEADAALRAGDYPQAERALAAVNAVLDALAAGGTSPFHADPLAGDHYAIVIELLAQGYDPQQITVDGETARALATLNSTELVELEMVRGEEGWRLE